MIISSDVFPSFSSFAYVVVANTFTKSNSGEEGTGLAYSSKLWRLGAEKSQRQNRETAGHTTSTVESRSERTHTHAAHSLSASFLHSYLVSPSLPWLGMVPPSATVSSYVS